MRKVTPSFQHSFQKQRELNRKEVRHEHLSQVFRKKREQISNQTQRQNWQIFQKILSSISLQSYGCDKRFLKGLLQQGDRFDFAYRMLGLMPIIQEYLLESDSLDRDSWEIISHLSEFDEFEMYQTDDVASLTLAMLEESMRLTVCSKDDLVINLGETCPLVFMTELICSLLRHSKHMVLCAKMIAHQNGLLVQLSNILCRTVSFHPESQLGSEKSPFVRGTLEIVIQNSSEALANVFLLQPTLSEEQYGLCCSAVRSMIISQGGKLYRIQCDSIDLIVFNACSNFSLPQGAIQSIIKHHKQHITNRFYTHETLFTKFIEVVSSKQIKLPRNLLHKLWENCLQSKKGNDLEATLNAIVKILKPSVQTDSNKEESFPKKQSQMEIQGGNILNFQLNNTLPSFEQFNSLYLSNSLTSLESNKSPKSAQNHQNQLYNRLNLLEIFLVGLDRNSQQFQIGLSQLQSSMSHLVMTFQQSSTTVKRLIADCIENLIRSLLEAKQILQNLGSHYDQEQFSVFDGIDLNQQFVEEINSLESVFELIYLSLESEDDLITLSGLNLIDVVLEEIEISCHSQQNQNESFESKQLKLATQGVERNFAQKLEDMGVKKLIEKLTLHANDDVREISSRVDDFLWGQSEPC